MGFGLTDLGSAKPLITPFIEKAGLFSIKAAQSFHKTSYGLRVKALKSIFPWPQNGYMY